MAGIGNSECKGQRQSIFGVYEKKQCQLERVRGKNDKGLGRWGEALVSQIRPYKPVQRLVFIMR